MRRSSVRRFALTVAVLAGLGTVLAACTPADGPSPEPSTTTSGETQSSPDPEPEGVSGGEPVGSNADDTLTYEDYVADLAVLYRIEDPPPVEMVREVRPSEWGEVFPPCMTEFGFTVEVFEDGSWGISTDNPIPAEQQDAYNEAAFTCEARYPLLPQFYRPWDEQTLQRVYDYLDSQVVPCVEDAGYSFALPSFGTFRARYAEDRSYVDGLDPVTLGNDVALQCGINIPESVLLDE